MHFAAVLHGVHGALRWFLRVCMLSRCNCVPLSAVPWTGGRQAPLSVGFSRHEHWNGWPCPPPGGLPDPGTEPTSPVSPALSGGFSPTEPPGSPRWSLLYRSRHSPAPPWGVIQALRTSHPRKVGDSAHLLIASSSLDFGHKP